MIRFDLPSLDLAFLLLGGVLTVVGFIRGYRRGYRSGWSAGSEHREANGPCRVCGECWVEGGN